jgi:hypothetical protein
MARAAPGVARHGTARDLAAVGVGYSASGASEHSRHSAHSANIKMRSDVEPNPRGTKITGPRSHGELIAENVKKLAALQVRLQTETDVTKRDKIIKGIVIKTKFLERLKSEGK